MHGTSPPPQPAPTKQPTPPWVPVAVVLGIIGFVVLGGPIVRSALSGNSGPPIQLTDTVAVTPLSGWRSVKSFDDPPGVELTRGSGNLDVYVYSFEGTASELAQAYIDHILAPDAGTLLWSKQFKEFPLPSGLLGEKFQYQGTFGDRQIPFEGEVVAVVTADGTAVVFDGWTSIGLLSYIKLDVELMAKRASIE